MKTKTQRFKLDGIYMDIDFDYQPEEFPVKYYQNDEYPSSNEIVEINTILIGGQDCTDLLGPIIERLEELLLIELIKIRK